MSYFTHKKRKLNLKTLLAILSFSLFVFALMSSPAYADPEKKVDNPRQPVEEKVDQSKEETKEMVKDAVPTPMALPETGEKAVKTEPEMKSTPASEKTQACYKQESGALECICEGDADCTALEMSGVCEPGTSWRNAEGFGGCSKKTE